MGDFILEENPCAVLERHGGRQEAGCSVAGRFHAQGTVEGCLHAFQRRGHLEFVYGRQGGAVGHRIKFTLAAQAGARRVAGFLQLQIDIGAQKPACLIPEI